MGILRALFRILFKLDLAKPHYFGLRDTLLSPLGLLRGEKQVSRQGLKWKLDLQDWIQSQIYYLGEYYTERNHLNAWLSLIKPGNYIIDIGANIGYYSLLSAHKHDVNIIAFEPDHKNRARLEEHLKLNTELNNIQIQPVALSNKTGNAFLNEHKSDNWGMSSLSTEETDRPTKTITLDEFSKDQELRSIDLIKIDTEGHELKIIEGGIECIKKYRPILAIEITSQNFANIYQLLQEINYTLRTINTQGEWEKDLKRTNDNLIFFIPEEHF